MTTTEHIIDAKGKRLGRVATEAAAFLLGKDSPAFAKNVVQNTQVKVINAGLMDITEKKKMQEEYQTYSGHPGGQTREKLGALGTRRGYSEALKRSIRGMLPKNKIRPNRLKNLIISE